MNWHTTTRQYHWRQSMQSSKWLCTQNWLPAFCTKPLVAKYVHFSCFLSCLYGCVFERETFYAIFVELIQLNLSPGPGSPQFWLGSDIGFWGLVCTKLFCLLFFTPANHLEMWRAIKNRKGSSFGMQKALTVVPVSKHSCTGEREKHFCRETFCLFLLCLGFVLLMLHTSVLSHLSSFFII